MQRRQFVSQLAKSAGLVAGARFLQGQNPPDSTVKRVLVMFKCHLDVGFVDTQANIIKKYFEVYFPRAIQLASTLRQAGGDRYVWTTGSWLIYQYLEQAEPAARKRMEQALTQGDVAWHALPFTWQSELLAPSMVSGGVAFSKSLDQRFGRKTTGAKMTDVPGHSRGLIKPLSEAGVTLLDIGVNSASTPPDVPDAFVWKDATGHSVIKLYHRKEYGGVVHIPRSPLAIAVEVRDDNAGPHTPDEIRQIYADLRKQFPSANIEAANLTDTANAVEPFKANLPVVTQEIGDTWIYGVASDPLKLAHYRELQRLRDEWLAASKLKIGDETDRAFLSQYILAVEHTWGTDTKTWLDFNHYTPAALASMLDDPKYRTVTGSWIEKRNDISNAVETLPAPLRAEAKQRIASLTPKVPTTDGLVRHDPANPITTTHFTLALDPATGAIIDLQNRKSQRRWASAQHPLAAYSYQTLSKEDYDHFLASYITVQTDWAPKDFGKPNIEAFGAQSRLWTPQLSECWAGDERVVLKLMGDGLPRETYVEMRLPKAEPKIELNLSWFGKRANRLPEALWLTFNPAVFTAQNWTLSKMDQPVSPFDVVPGGNRRMHAVSTGLTYRDSRGSFAIETLDAPLVVLGERSPIQFSKAAPDLSQGIHFSLFNNGWGTNYVQWFGDDMQFRFVLRPT